MEEMIQRLKDHGRFLELEILIPELKEKLTEGKRLLREAGLETAQNKWAYSKLEKGSFFQRLRGNWEKKKEAAWQNYRAAERREQEYGQAVSFWEEQLAQEQKELAALTGSLERYLQQREGYLLSGGDRDALLEAQKEQLAAIAAKEVDRCIAALEGAHGWMQEDAIRKGVGQENRKMEFLKRAGAHVENIKKLLPLLPEHTVEAPDYMRNPDGFILNYTSEFKQLDRLNLAVEQLRKLKKEIMSLQ